MIHTTFIARLSDGLMLAENYEDSNESLIESKRKVKQLLKSQIANKTLKDLECIEVGEFYLNCKKAEGIIYMVLCDKKYPIKLSSIYLDDIYQGFIEELKSHYGTHNVDFSSKIETIEEPYYFVKFDRFIKKKKNEYLDVRSNENTERLKNDLYKLQNIVSQNIDLILDRGNNLSKIQSKAAALKESSIKFKDKSQKLAWNMWIKKNMLYFIIAFTMLAFVYLKFF